MSNDSTEATEATEETIDPRDFIDPNSGIAPQPGGFANALVQVDEPVKAEEEERVEGEPSVLSQAEPAPKVEGEAQDNGSGDGGSDQSEGSKALDAQTEAAAQGNPDGTANVPDNDTEAAANGGDLNLDGQAETHEAGSSDADENEGDGDTSTQGEQSSTEQPEQNAGEQEEKPETKEPNDYTQLLSNSVPKIEKYVSEHPEEKDEILKQEKSGKARAGVLNL